MDLGGKIGQKFPQGRGPFLELRPPMLHPSNEGLFFLFICQRNVSAHEWCLCPGTSCHRCAFGGGGGGKTTIADDIGHCCEARKSNFKIFKISSPPDARLIASLLCRNKH